MQMITSTSDAPGDISQRVAWSFGETAQWHIWGEVFFVVEDEGGCVSLFFFVKKTLVIGNFQYFEWLGIRGRNLKM